MSNYLVPPRRDTNQTVLPLAVNINKVHEVAPWSRTTTYKLVSEGRLPARKLGRSTFVLVADLERFIASLDEVVSK